MGSWAQNLQYLRNGARYDQDYYDGLIGSRIRAFDWYQNQWPWMTLNGQNALLRKKSFYGAHQKNLKMAGMWRSPFRPRLRRFRRDRDIEHSIRDETETSRYSTSRDGLETETTFLEDRPKVSSVKCRSMILGSRYIRYMQIFAGVPRGGGVKRHCGCRSA